MKFQVCNSQRGRFDFQIGVFFSQEKNPEAPQCFYKLREKQTISSPEKKNQSRICAPPIMRVGLCDPFSSFVQLPPQGSDDDYSYTDMRSAHAGGLCKLSRRKTFQGMKSLPSPCLIGVLVAPDPAGAFCDLLFIGIS